LPFASISVDGPIATLTLDAPVEGIGRPFMDSLRQACEDLASATDRIFAVVVRPAGQDFGTGWSPEGLAAGEGAEALTAPIGAGCDALALLPQPTIAAARGRAHSVGLEIALACDVRVCAEDATFAMPETALGMVPRGGGTQRLPRAVGRAHALRMLLTGEEVDAMEALQIGLVSRVVPLGEEVGAAGDVAGAIAERGPIATRYAKEAVTRGLDLPLQQGLRAELDLTVILQTTADRAEGVAAFIERREPRFTGR
jgi:enoyl-CoA hydratase/carnithine racemase